MATDLKDRLDRLERELIRLEIELGQVRALVAEEERPEVEPAHAAPVAAPIAPPPEPEPSIGITARPAPPPAAAEIPAAPRPARAEVRAEAPVERVAVRVPSRPASPPKPPGRSLRQLAEDWDLVGPRGFAIVGGAVLALGIGLFFVLAANRGWIDESARVVLGAAASALALGTGIWLRARYGQYWAALGAVGAGIAGAYATLAAATARYDLVPDELGLPLAGGIAAIGTAIAVRWNSQVIAALGLLGAALAPALQALDTGLSWESVAFALIVLAAAVVVTVPRKWHELLEVTTALVAIQALALVRDVGPPADRGTVGVTVTLTAIVLVAAVWLQLASVRRTLDALALTYALIAFGLPLATTSWLFGGQTDRGLALVAVAAIWVVALGVLAWKRQPDLALVVGVSALALTAVGTALLLTGSALTVAWAAQAIVLALLAARFADARLLATGVAYSVLATLYALGSDAVPGTLFDAQADHRGAVVPLAACAAGLVAAGFATRSAYTERTETGLLAFLRDLRRALERYRLGLREVLLYAGAAAATLAASFMLVSTSWDWGHVAATELAAVVGAAILVVAGVRRRDGLALAAYAWLAGIFLAALAFDVPEFYVDETKDSIGGWSLVAAATALLGGTYAHRLLWPASRVRDLVAGCAVTIAAIAGALGIAFVTGSQRATGIGLLAATVAYVALAAGVFRRPERRDLATTLWSLALTLLLGAEVLLVTTAEWRAATVAATALAAGAIARPLGEERLWLAGGALAVAATASTVITWIRPLVEGGEPTRDGAIATASCAVAALALAGLRFGEARRRDLVTALWIVGLLAVLATERLMIADAVWLATAIAATAVVPAVLARPLREERLWLAGGTLAVATTGVVVLEQARPWLTEPELFRRLAIATAACALASFATAALRWGEASVRDLVTVLWVVGFAGVLTTERILLGDVRATAIAFALTGGALALVARPLREPRVWTVGATVVGATLIGTIVEWTPPAHLFVASENPADGLWVLVACLLGLAAVAATSPDLQTRVALEVVTGGIALYALSLGILEVAERVSGASVETDFERGHTAVSGLWALVGLALLVAGLLRGSTALRYGGLALFGLSLAKIFLYDLSSLSSLARAFSFILVGGLLLAGGFFLQRLSDRLGPPRHP